MKLLRQWNSAGHCGLAKKKGIADLPRLIQAGHASERAQDCLHALRNHTEISREANFSLRNSSLEDPTSIEG